MVLVTKSATENQVGLLPTRQTTPRLGRSIVSGMATRIRKGVKPYLYIDEWVEKLGLSDETIANRLDRARETIWRWRREKRRLTPEKQAELAHALGIEPEDLWRHPNRPSLDALVNRESDDLHATAVDIVRRLVKKAS